MNKKNKYISAAVTVMLYPQGYYIVAYCPALDLSSYARTENEAVESF